MLLINKTKSAFLFWHSWQKAKKSNRQTNIHTLWPFPTLCILSTGLFRRLSGKAESRLQTAKGMQNKLFDFVDFAMFKVRRSNETVRLYFDSCLSGYSLYPQKIIFKWVFMNFRQAETSQTFPLWKYRRFSALPIPDWKPPIFLSGVATLPKG